jgi:Sulfotransferase family
LLPNARVIHCIRSPEDTCFSLYKHLFPGGFHPYSYNLTELGTYYRLYAGLMQHWQQMLPGFICNVNYEVLVNDQRGQLEKMLSFCDLPWHEACMHYYKSGNKSITASSMQVTQPIYRSALNYWRRYEKFLQPLRDELHTH